MGNRNSENFTITYANEAHVDPILRLAEASALGLVANHTAEANGFLVSNFTENQYRMFISRADHFYVIAGEERIIGFALAYSSGSIDPSWEVDSFIQSRYSQPFVVIKQIAIHIDFRRRGLAARLYEHLIGQVSDHAFFAAVVLQPYNYASVRFHERFNFHKVLEITPLDGRLRAIWRRDPMVNLERGDADE